MNREFLTAYNRELSILYERAKEFAEDYPGIAERLGGLTEERLDPGIAGLLEGAAFLAARVQVKQQSEYANFTTALIDQLLPNYLAPTPAAMLVRAHPDFARPDLVTGHRFDPGAYLDANYVERDQRVSCRFRLSAPLELWPLALDRASYHAGPGPLQTLGLDVLPQTAGGLRLRLARHIATSAQPLPDEPAAGAKPAPLSAVSADRLPIMLSGLPADLSLLYEQIFNNCIRITARYLDAQNTPVFLPIPPGMVEQVGFDPEEMLFPEDEELFSGFSLLREFTILPQKFMGFRLTGLQKLLPRIPAQAVDLIFEFDRVHPRLGPVLSPQNFNLFTVPAVNLFEERCTPVSVGPGHSEFLVVPESSPAVNYEINRMIEVSGHYAGVRKKVTVNPVYSLPASNERPQDALYYALRRRPRRLSERERRFGSAGDYIGTETLIALHEPAGLDAAERVERLQARALCSNRHLTMHLPIGKANVDFRLSDDVQVGLSCVAGPTPPRASILEAERPNPRTGGMGERQWRLINFLAFNQFGLQDRHPSDPAGGLREVMALFADLSDAVTERQVRGITGVRSRPVTRSIRRPDGYHAARGTEVTVTLDERAFEGAGIALLGAVLDRFFADYAHLNSFTETVITSATRGEVMRWPPRSGTGPVL
ncbi:type VI secretion system baseplate subunit TssF [Acidimangrovimonas sediminis]|uniref:type VI secretion system baseplate subunit TssF n=1 Tax=Acidimangrovimonas sediminis TaxID=2056283 RepID=UPI000C80DEE2|nr:type VI secretion system baseplate subunit TssF [Acidimangrovimonas sediminis]